MRSRPPHRLRGRAQAAEAGNTVRSRRRTRAARVHRSVRLRRRSATSGGTAPPRSSPPRAARRCPPPSPTRACARAARRVLPDARSCLRRIRRLSLQNERLTEPSALAERHERLDLHRLSRPPDPDRHRRQVSTLPAEPIDLRALQGPEPLLPLLSPSCLHPQRLHVRDPPRLERLLHQRPLPIPPTLRRSVMTLRTPRTQAVPHPPVRPELRSPLHLAAMPAHLRRFAVSHGVFFRFFRERLARGDRACLQKTVGRGVRCTIGSVSARCRVSSCLRL